jgi:hypothetical protein
MDNERVKVMKRYKKLIFVLLIAMPLICAQDSSGLHAMASADTDGLVYAITNGEAVVTGYTGGASTVAIPKEAQGYPVTAIGSQAFKGNISLKEIILHPAIASIGEQAFAGCIGLSKIDIPAGVAMIGQ